MFSMTILPKAACKLHHEAAMIDSFTVEHHELSAIAPSRASSQPSRLSSVVSRTAQFQGRWPRRRVEPNSRPASDATRVEAVHALLDQR